MNNLNKIFCFLLFKCIYWKLSSRHQVLINVCSGLLRQAYDFFFFIIIMIIMKEKGKELLGCPSCGLMRDVAHNQFLMPFQRLRNPSAYPRQGARCPVGNSCCAGLQEASLFHLKLADRKDVSVVNLGGSRLPLTDINHVSRFINFYKLLQFPHHAPLCGIRAWNNCRVNLTFSAKGSFEGQKFRAIFLRIFSGVWFTELSISWCLMVIKPSDSEVVCSYHESHYFL